MYLIINLYILLIQLFFILKYFILKDDNSFCQLISFNGPMFTYFFRYDTQIQPNYFDKIKYIILQKIKNTAIHNVYQIKYNNKEAILKRPKKNLAIKINIGFYLLQIYNKTSEINEIYEYCNDQINMLNEYKNTICLRDIFWNDNIINIPFIHFKSSAKLILSHQKGLSFDEFIKIQNIYVNEVVSSIYYCIFKMLESNLILLDFGFNNLTFYIENNSVKINLINISSLRTINNQQKKIIKKILNHLSRGKTKKNKLVELFYELSDQKIDTTKWNKHNFL